MVTIQEASNANIEKEKDEILCVYDRHAGFVNGAIWALKEIKYILGRPENDYLKIQAAMEEIHKILEGIE